MPSLELVLALFLLQSRMKRLADSKRGSWCLPLGMRLCLTLNTSDILLVVSWLNLSYRWIGPFQVIRRISLASAYELELELPMTMPNIHDVFHVSLLETLCC